MPEPECCSFQRFFFCSPDESMPYYHDTERSSHIKSRNLDPMFPWFFSHTSAMAPNALAEKKIGSLTFLWIKGLQIFGSL